MKNIAISACLLGKKCRYDARDNYHISLLEKLQEDKLIPFCPEDALFGTPRSTMDLIEISSEHRAISNKTGEDLSASIRHYAKTFFDTHENIDLFIGKDRSPSCGVCSAKLYDKNKSLLSTSEAGLMAKEALKRKIEAVDADKYDKMYRYKYVHPSKRI